MSVEGSLAKAWGAGCLRGMAIRIVAGIIGLCVVTSLIVVTMLIPLPPEMEDYRPILWAFGFVGFLAVFTVFAVGLFLALKKQRAAQFDAGFTPLGLTGSNYLTNGRQYHGQVGGRKADAYFYRGPILDLYIASPLRTRMGIGRQSALGGLASSAMNRPALQTDHPELAGLSIYPIDERWGRELLEDPRARAIIQRLSTPRTSFEVRNLLLQPDCIQLKLAHTAVGLITPENLRGWFGDLTELAQIAEQLPSPSVTAEPSALEQASRSDRNTITRKVVWITLGVMGLLLLCSVAIMVPLAIWLGSSG